MNKRYIFLALFALIVLGLVILIVAGYLAPSRPQGVLPPSGIEKIDTRRMDGSLSEEGRVAFLNAAVKRLISRMAGFETDPAFWGMLTPEGQAVLSGVTVTVSDEPRSYACPQVYEVGAPTPTPAVCTFYGGVYHGATNTIELWGEAAQANPDILRHEALHALDVADGQPESESCVEIISIAPPRWSVGCFQRLVGKELAREAEALYEAGGGTWFRPNELYAIVPFLVDWHFEELPAALSAYYAQWFLDAAEAAP